MKKRHPQDVLEVAIATASAARRICEWLEIADNRMALEALVLTFDDEEAAELLPIIREQFWSKP